jgi:DNA-directed RNA polymerase subunit K/omega
MGVAVNIDSGAATDPVGTAERELLSNQTPLIIRRYLPNWECEDVGIRILIVSAIT